MTSFCPDQYEYAVALSENRLDDAKKHLLAMIIEAGRLDARPVLSGLAQRLGSILLRQCDKNGAIALYELSVVLDKGSLLSKLEYAKFLLNEVGDNIYAQNKCNEIIMEATTHPFAETDDDFGSEEYIQAAKRIFNNAEGDNGVRLD